MRCSRYGNLGRMHVILNGDPLEEVDCFKYPGSQVAADGGFLLLLLVKKVGSARLRESEVQLISPKTPAPQYQPIDRKKRKGKRVEDYSRGRAA